jgi:Flp pilus assembly protein TadG
MYELRSQIRNHVRDERGATLVFVAVSLSVLLGMAALAVDTGMLLTARTESQRVTDAAAMAGAVSLIVAPENEDLARQTAIDYAAENAVRGDLAVVLPEDVDVDMVNDLVRVRHFRTAERTNPIQTFFATLLGVDETGVATVAAAQAFPADAIYCPLPITLPDRWHNFGSDEWDPEGEGDYYYPPEHAETISYTEYDIGEAINLFPSQGGTNEGQGGGTEGDRFEPGFYFPWLPQPFSGTPEIQDRILGCLGDDPIRIGDPMWHETGNKQAIEQAFEELIAAYPDEYYEGPENGGCNCVMSSSTGKQVTASMRLRPIPMFEPPSHTQQGSGPHFSVSNFAGVWMDHVDPGPAGKRNVWARFMGFTGVAYAGGTGSSGPGSMIKVLKLVE